MPRRSHSRKLPTSLPGPAEVSRSIRKPMPRPTKVLTSRVVKERGKRARKVVEDIQDDEYSSSAGYGGWGYDE